MSIIWDLKKINFSTNPKTNKFYKLKKEGPICLTKSYSFNNSNFCKTPLNNNRFKKIFNNNSSGKTQNGEKLRNKNVKLKIKLNDINKELILAKSAGNKKIFQLQQNNKLLNKAITIKKLTFETEQNNIKSSSYSFNKKCEEDITLKGFKSNLIQKIRNQFLDLEKDNKKKKSIISDLKNSINNFNNNKELLNINKKLMHNFISLKNKYDLNLERNNEYKLKMREYIDIEEKLNKKNFCILELKESLNDINNSNINLENDIDKLKNKLKKLEIENDALNNDYYFLNEKLIQASKDKNELENKFEILVGDNK